MEREEKIQNMIEKLTKEPVSHNVDSLEITLFLNEEPVPYARSRFTRFGGSKGKGRVYNQNGNYMKRIRKVFQSQIDKQTKEKIKNIIDDQENHQYYVTVSGNFYISIPKSESIKRTALKELQIIRPTNRRGDVDNYIKLILDVLHEVVYDDDSHVISVSSEKYFSINPRVELQIKIEYEV